MAKKVRIPTTPRKVGTKKSKKLVSTRTDKLGGKANTGSKVKGRGSLASQRAKEQRRIAALKKKRAAAKK